MVDTVKRCIAGQVETIDRQHLWLAQTPQMFTLGLLSRALAMAIEVTDEASAIEAIGYHPNWSKARCEIENSPCLKI